MMTPQHFAVAQISMAGESFDFKINNVTDECTFGDDLRVVIRATTGIYVSSNVAQYCCVATVYASI